MFVSVFHLFIYQADELRQGHPHPDRHLVLPVLCRSDFHVVVLKELLMEPPLCFRGSWMKGCMQRDRK